MTKSALRKLLPSSTRGHLERRARWAASELFDGELAAYDICSLLRRPLDGALCQVMW